MLFGEGALRGVMFIGEGPVDKEEKTGRLGTDNAGRLLRAFIKRAGLEHVSYYTNLTCCHNCGASYRADGSQNGFTTPNGVFRPTIEGLPPRDEHVAACMPRLLEQIYLVDPVFVVLLGARVTKELTKSTSILTDSGTFRVLEIPGHGHVPAVTDKKGVWTRRKNKVLVSPIERNVVQYLAMPLIEPSYALNKVPDMRDKSAYPKFGAGFRLLALAYRSYIYELSGNYAEGDVTVQNLLKAVSDLKETEE